MTEAEVRALFLLAHIEVKKTFQIENDYWPEAYVELRQKSPWWLVQTEHGLIKIGWRKRVISINWNDTRIRTTITKDDTTKDPDMVHAWTYGKAVEYLTRLARCFELSVYDGLTPEQLQTLHGITLESSATAR